MSDAKQEGLTLTGIVRGARARVTGGGMGARMTRGALISLIIQVAGAGLSFVGQIVLSRSLGHQGFGVYLVALAAMNAAQVVGKLELDSAATRFLGAYVGTQRWSLARGFVRWSRHTLSWVSLSVAAVGALVVVLGWKLFLREHPSMPYALLAACALLPVSAKLVINSAYLQGIKHYAEAQLAGTLVRPALLSVTLATLYWGLDLTLSPTVGVLVNLGTAAIALGLTWVFLKRCWPQGMHDAVPAYEHPVWRNALGGMMVVGLSQLVVSQTLDLLVIGAILSTKESALYGAASQLTLLLSFGQMSVNFVAAPMIADLFARGQKEQLQRMIRLVMAASAVITVPVLLGLILFGRYILRLYGPEFEAAYPVLIVLGVSAAWVSLVGSLGGFVLTMTDYQREAGRLIAGSALLNLVLTLMLTPAFGMMGTAAATLAATVTRGIALSVFIRRNMGLRLL